jgi:DNA-binding response OmpR family regulator
MRSYGSRDRSECRKRVLLVGDTPDLRGLLEMVLRHASFDVMSASINSQAMEILEKFYPDILLTDCFLNGAGLMLAQVLRRSRPEMPIVVLSGGPVTAREILPETNVVLGKPVATSELLRTFLGFSNSIESEPAV